jgi:8-oxo-dGTP pyrophosphatase MutT (NUDIX family)
MARIPTSGSADPSSIPVEPARLQASAKYRLWKTTVETNGCTVHKAEILLDLPRRDGTILFAMLKAEITDPEGRPLPHFALLRGPAVVIVTAVENRDTGERRFLMLRQRRIGHGGDSLEFPAGMLDELVTDPKGVAVKELAEETGLQVDPAELRPLADRPLYSSSGLDDEAIHYLGCEVKLSGADYHALEGGQRGNAEEGEFIRLGLFTYEDALKEVTSLQVRLGFHLYFETLKDGRREP